MNKSLEIAKSELEWLTKKYKVNVERIKNKFQDKLRFSITYNRKKTVLSIEFIFMPNQNALGLAYEYAYKQKEKEIIERHNFSNVHKDEKLPAINAEDIQRLKDNIKFDIVENKIMGMVSPTTQAITYTEIIKRNIDEMLEYGKKLCENK